jgi:hypothetical protein
MAQTLDGEPFRSPGSSRQVPSAYLAKNTNGALCGHYWVAYERSRNLPANTRNQNERVTQQGGRTSRVRCKVPSCRRRVSWQE